MTDLDALEIPADLVTIPVFGSVEEVLDDGILVVELSERVQHDRTSQRFLSKSPFSLYLLEERDNG